MQFEYDSGVFRVDNCRLGISNVSEDCDVAQYTATLWAWAIPSCIFAFLVLLLSCVYFVRRYCCRGCWFHNKQCFPWMKRPSAVPAKGESNSSVNPIGKGIAKRKAPRPRVYSYGDLLRPKLLVFVCVVLTMAGCIWGCVGTTNVILGLRTMDHVVATTTANCASTSNGIVEATTRLLALELESDSSITAFAKAFYQGNASSMGELHREAVEAMHSMSAQTNDVLSDFINRYMWIGYLLLTTAALCAAALCLACVWHLRHHVPTVLLAVYMILAVLMFGFHGVLLMNQYLVHDGCREVLDFAFRRSNNLAALSGCHSATDVIASFRREQQSLLTAFTEAMCRSVNQGSPVDDSTYMDCAEATPHKVLLALSRKDTGPSSTVSTTTDDAAESRRDVLFALQVSLSQETALRSCHHLLELTVPPLAPVCGQMVSGSVAAAQGVGMVAFACITGILALIFGQRRFLPLSQAFIPQYQT